MVEAKPWPKSSISEATPHACQFAQVEQQLQDLMGQVWMTNAGSDLTGVDMATCWAKMLFEP